MIFDETGIINNYKKKKFKVKLSKGTKDCNT